MDSSGPNVAKVEPLKLPDHTQPSDYSDVQPKSYDPDYISHISSKMQVPHRIAVDNADQNGALNDAKNSNMFTGMMVPDKIILAVEDNSCHQCLTSPTIRLQSPDFTTYQRQRSSLGDNQHIEMRSDLASDLKSDGPVSSDSLAFASLITPPRTLTMNETFPVVEENEDKQSIHNVGDRAHPRQTVVSGNGYVPAPVPYEPGVNPHDSLLLTEEDETIVLRTQVAKLTRRVQVIEQDHQRRAQRELVLYPVILGYFLWKVLGWFVRDR